MDSKYPVTKKAKEDIKEVRYLAGSVGRPVDASTPFCFKAQPFMPFSFGSGAESDAHFTRLTVLLARLGPFVVYVIN